MKITNINRRFDKSGKHNDRNFELEKAPHIDAERVKNNKYWNYTERATDKTFAEIELEFYKDNFQERLDAQNEKFRKHSNYKRVKSMDAYRTAYQTRPEDKILQVGNIKEHATAEELWECALEYQRKFDDLYGDYCKILTMALHMDEATPHVHVRRVWIAKDDNGNQFVSQTQALQQMGQSKPEEDKPEGRRNNEKYMFTQIDSRLFRDICIENGLDISDDLPVRRRQLTKEEYIKQQMFFELGERIQEETHIYDNGIALDSKDSKSDKEFITEVNDALDNNEELSMQTIVEFEMRRQREDARRRGHLSEYHKDMIEYMSKIKAAHADIDKKKESKGVGRKNKKQENKDEFF